MSYPYRQSLDKEICDTLRRASSGDGGECSREIECLLEEMETQLHERGELHEGVLSVEAILCLFGTLKCFPKDIISINREASDEILPKLQESLATIRSEVRK
jgi:hypothetical protein